jgi:hypothetical protein
MKPRMMLVAGVMFVAMCSSTTFASVTIAYSSGIASTDYYAYAYASSDNLFFEAPGTYEQTLPFQYPTTINSGPGYSVSAALGSSEYGTNLAQSIHTTGPPDVDSISTYISTTNHNALDVDEFGSDPTAPSPVNWSVLMSFWLNTHVNGYVAPGQSVDFDFQVQVEESYFFEYYEFGRLTATFAGGTTIYSNSASGQIVGEAEGGTAFDMTFDPHHADSLFLGRGVINPYNETKLHYYFTTHMTGSLNWNGTTPGASWIETVDPDFHVAVQIPEPSSLILAALGLTALVVWRKR